MMREKKNEVFFLKRMLLIIVLCPKKMQDQKSANIKGIEDRDKKQTKSSVCYNQRQIEETQSIR